MKLNQSFRLKTKNQLLLLITVISLTQTGCALSTSSPVVVTTCSVPTDQSGSINGHWLTHPISIAFHAGDFSASEISAMIQAADTWNQFFNSSKSFPIFTYGSTGSPQITPTGNFAGTGVCSGSPNVANGSFVTPVGIYKVASWPYSSNVIALTSTCTQAGSSASSNGQIYSSITGAVMEVNYSNFFVSGTPQPDLQSVFLHELGHLLGLDHSCGSKPNMPNCGDPNLNQAYSTAVMYPTFSFDALTGLGSSRQALTANDESRANCLY